MITRRLAGGCRDIFGSFRCSFCFCLLGRDGGGLIKNENKKSAVSYIPYMMPGYRVSEGEKNGLLFKKRVRTGEREREREETFNFIFFSIFESLKQTSCERVSSSEKYPIFFCSLINSTYRQASS